MLKCAINYYKKLLKCAINYIICLVNKMKRLALTELIKWINNPKRKPLIIWGARQVGKTYLVKDIFAQEYFKDNYIYIDFRLEKDIKDFCDENVDPKKIIEFISLVKNKQINKNTLIIFDEVQECLGIITSLKYFCQDFREQPVIATGSMVRIKLNRLSNKRGVKSENKFLFPVGKINQLTLYPMSFEEFLLNYNFPLYNVICESYKNKKALDDSYHKLAINTLYKYLLIGGMPEAVEVFLEEESYFESRETLKELYDNYLSDMQLYQASPESIIRSKKIFENIYSELNKENKNFKASIIEKNSKNRDMKTPIDWLTTSMIVHKSYLVKEKVTCPLIQDDNSNYRLYLSDIGMFSYQSGINTSSFLNNDSNNVLSGIFFENYVANEIISKGLKLYYWKGKNDSEIEFLIENNNNIYPIDVKKGRGSLNSLSKFRDHNPKTYAIKFSKNNYGIDKENKILTIPLYEVFLVLNDLSQKSFEI